MPFDTVDSAAGEERQDHSKRMLSGSNHSASTKKSIVMQLGAKMLEMLA